MTAATKQPFCQASVYRGSTFRSGTCNRRATMQLPDGKRVCSLHDPAAIKARDDVKRARWDEEAKQRECKYARLDLVRDAALALQQYDGPVILPEVLHNFRDRLRATAS